MKPIRHSITVYFLFFLVMLCCSCEQQEMTITAKLSLRNECEPIHRPDSLQVVMRFIDKDGKPVIDADVVTLIPASDSIMKLNLTLRKTDKWMVKKILNKDGSPFCEGCLSDTIRRCIDHTSNNDFVPVDSIAKISVYCHCD